MPRKGPEYELQLQITQLATILGWEHMAIRPMMTKQQGFRTGTIGTMAKGWPDLVLVRPRDRRLIFAELKGSKRDKLRPDQGRVLDVLRALEGEWWSLPNGHDPDAPMRIEVHLWRPDDWPDIEAALK